MSDHNALQNLLGDAEVDDSLLRLFRGGAFSAGKVNAQFFTPFMERLSLGEAVPFREGNFSLKDFIQEVNKNLAD